KNDYVREAYQKYEKNTREKASKTSGVEQNSTLRFIQALVEPTCKWEPECDRALVLMYIYGYGAHFDIKYTSTVPQEWQVVNKKVPEAINSRLPQNPIPYLALAGTAQSVKEDLASQQARWLVGQLREQTVAPNRRKELRKTFENFIKQVWGRLQHLNGWGLDQGRLDAQKTDMSLWLLHLGLAGPEENHQHIKQVWEEEITERPAGYIWDWTSDEISQNYNHCLEAFLVDLKSELDFSLGWPYLVEAGPEILKAALAQAETQERVQLINQAHCMLLHNLGVYLWWLGIGFAEASCRIMDDEIYQSRVEFATPGSDRMMRILRGLCIMGYADLARTILRTIEDQAKKTKRTPLDMTEYKAACAAVPKCLLPL
ncbi:MAG: hypothetical protein LBF56_00420, partial [Holosporales bacterium]|nr:hypothetical protein [Holosporales bacterium]